LVESPLPPPPPGATIAPLAAEVKHAGRTRSKSEWLSAGQGISGVIRYNARLIARTYRGAHSCAMYGFEPSRAGPRRWRRPGTRWPGSAWRLPRRPRESLAIGPCSNRGHHRNRRLIARKVLRPVPARRRFSSSSS